MVPFPVLTHMGKSQDGFPGREGTFVLTEG